MAFVPDEPTYMGSFIPDEPVRPLQRQQGALMDIEGFIPDELTDTGGFFPELGKGIIRGALNVGAATVGTSRAATKLLRKIPTWDILYRGIESVTGKTVEEEQVEFIRNG
ncbi:unnamed protein product [marine sediment metagenome]|uniref:Uncharacterized protein n=1 Tax=marine sediment metagenome TaxID=412755 RepID=X1AK27_9ZZZZ